MACYSLSANALHLKTCPPQHTHTHTHTFTKPIWLETTTLRPQSPTISTIQVFHLLLPHQSSLQELTTVFKKGKSRSSLSPKRQLGTWSCLWNLLQLCVCSPCHHSLKGFHRTIYATRGLNYDSNFSLKYTTAVYFDIITQNSIITSACNSSVIAIDF